MTPPLQLLTPPQTTPKHPLFVYLPGLDGTGELFYRQIEALQTEFDLRCLSLSPRYCSSWPSLVKATLSQLEAELDHPARPVYLCGESFGGCLALQVAIAQPQLIDRLILINPASSFRQRPLFAWATPFIRYLPLWLHQSSSVGFLPFLAALGRMTEPDWKALLTAMQSVPPETVSSRLDLLRTFSPSPWQLQAFPKPVLLIAGAQDQLLPSVTEITYLAGQFPQAKTVILPDSGHACLLEKEVNLYKILKEQGFLPAIFESGQIFRKTIHPPSSL